MLLRGWMRHRRECMLYLSNTKWNDFFQYGTDHPVMPVILFLGPRSYSTNDLLLNHNHQKRKRCTNRRADANIIPFVPKEAWALPSIYLTYWFNRDKIFSPFELSWQVAKVSHKDFIEEPAPKQAKISFKVRKLKLMSKTTIKVRENTTLLKERSWEGR